MSWSVANFHFSQKWQSFADDGSEAGFVALRNARDKMLPMPKLILHALQVNIAGGRLPVPEANGTRYLKFPLNALAGAAVG